MARKFLLVVLVAMLLQGALRAEELRVRLNFENAQTRVVVQEMARQLDLELVSLSGMSGRLTVHGENITASNAFAALEIAAGVRCQVVGRKLIASVPLAHPTLDMSHAEVSEIVIGITEGDPISSLRGWGDISGWHPPGSVELDPEWKELEVP